LLAIIAFAPYLAARRDRRRCDQPDLAAVAVAVAGAINVLVENTKKSPA
jgi:hypothetical protein